MASVDHPPVRIGLVSRVAAGGSYLTLLFVVRAAEEEWGLASFACATLAGFALGVFIARWEAMLLGVIGLAASVGASPEGTTSVSPLLACWYPATIGFGVLGAHSGRSRGTGRSGLRLLLAGASMVCIAIICLAVVRATYNDDAPVRTITFVGFMTAVVLGPAGLGLLGAGVLAALRPKSPS